MHIIYTMNVTETLRMNFSKMWSMRKSPEEYLLELRIREEVPSKEKFKEVNPALDPYIHLLSELLPTRWSTDPSDSTEPTTGSSASLAKPVSPLVWMAAPSTQKLDRPPISSLSLLTHTQPGHLLLLIKVLKHSPLFYFPPFLTPIFPYITLSQIQSLLKCFSNA